MPPPLDPALRRYRALIEQQRIQLSRALGAAFVQLPGHDEADAARYIAAMGPVVAGAKAATTSTSAAFSALLLDLPTPAVTAQMVATSANLRTPFTAMWHAFSEHRPYTEALAAGRSAAEATGESFVQSTARRTGDAVAEVTGQKIRWQRVAEPGSCPWCAERNGGIYISAADGDYGHDRCHCDVIPVAA